MGHQEPSNPLTPPSARQTTEPGTQPLRLLRRDAGAITPFLDALEAAYSSHHRDLLLSLAALEAELVGMESAHAQRAREQLSFLRVGLRCLAEAIGEVHAHIAQIVDDGDVDPLRRLGEPRQ